MRTFRLSLLCLFFCVTAVAQEPSEFKTPPTKFRPDPLWFWNNTDITKEGIDAQMPGFLEKCGYGGLAILPFGPNLTPKYLTEEYFERYKYAVEKAAELGQTLSLYDEYGFPSGSGGAINADGVPRFRNRFPNLTMKRLDKIEEETRGGATYVSPVSKTGQLMAAVAMNADTKERIDLSGNITEETIVWKVPEGNWKIMQFVCVADDDPNMDYLSEEAAKAYISMTHEAYYKRMPEFFGTTITSTFFDEPTLYRAQARCWTPTFNETYIKKYGSSPALYYPALWYDIGPETQAARNALFGLRAELYAAAYPKAVSEWSKAHGIVATGHQDNEEIENPVGTSADLMKCFKYQDVPGIDKIGGDRPAEKFYKIVSSAAYNWDHSLVMSETYGAMGNIPWDTLYNVAMDQYSKGINMLIPHAVWFNDRDVTFEPELSHRNRLYNQGLYEFNTFLARLNMLLRNDDRFVTDVAMLYPIETMQGEHYFDGPLGAYAGGVKIPDMDYVQISQRLTNELGRDFQFLHPEVLQDACRVDKNGLTLANTKQYNTFRTLIVPSSKTISVANLAKILTFFEAGGQVIFTTQLPVKSTEPNADAQVVALMDKLLPEKLRSSGEPHTNPAGGRVVFLAKPGADALRNALARPSETFDVEFPEGIVPMRYIHKERAGKDIYYFANLNGKAFDSAVALRGKKRYELWNPHTGEVTALQPEYAKKGKDRVSLVRLRVEPSQSVFLVETK
ncbi:MAG: glycosyl hydrolase [Rikenellaceae bacterium]|nr:glycosyl hydrolase [Rikenellaceae bacterium]